ncbi:Short-chain dehydrogenase/reductase family protein [Rasamsonia emersonii CBS 393.64]|uniref:Short-chain dehydrogenase/reductase family protein n=1 Tax=Rasamsonia emersonii (strain ATCC 16479 / CBS 393.64 / IMI 116815) TaxID=1408163 RepID=A0A0F4YKZ1_RASE3|nr:Short-chain dehydrogenase/reductase family protein [Rasamsonia emersonii CBS 393.64]KKA18770.1 Short-chain dehydrogenase/reductase family protein [Rasamsonia emersonii CBS 393.64]
MTATTTTESEQQQSPAAAAKHAKPSSLWQDLGALGSLLAYGLRNPWEMYTGAGPTLNELTCGLAGSSFKPKRDIGDLAGKVIFVTGGKETILQLAHHRPHRIYLAARTESKARDAIASIKAAVSSPVDIRYIPLDLASFASIKNAASQFTSECERLDILILNAGIMGHPPQTTEAGHEIQFGTNHVGHFLLTKLLLPTLLRTASTNADADVRVITVASIASGVASSFSFDELTSTPGLLAASTWQRYGASKAANILFASELARRHPELLSVSVHPGVVKSDLYETTKARNAFARYVLDLTAPLAMRTVSSGALNQLWAAAGASREQLASANGAFYTPVGNVHPRNRFVADAEMARRLWEWTEGEVSRALA